jgi:hypothetical protein
MKELTALNLVLPKEKPHFVIGDLNSLRRADYTDEAWDKMAAIRAEGQWEEPLTFVTDTMMKWGYQDVLAEFGTPASTCRFDTRVDYIYRFPQLLGTSSDTVAFIADSQGSSDHNLVIFEFK